MTATRTLVLACLGLALSGCATGAGKATLRVDARQLGGVETTATLELPEGWYQSGKRPDRLVFSAPDNFTTLSFAIQSVRGDGSQCPGIAKSAAVEAAKGGQPELMAPAEDVTDWRLTVPASPPGPSDRYVQGRAMCRKGALAVVSCSTGVKRKDSTGLECAKILASLAIGGETGPVPTSVTLPVAAGAGSEPAPAAAEAPAPASAPAASTSVGVPAGKDLVVFATTQVDADPAKATGLQTRFTCADPIYGRLFLATDLRKFLDGSPLKRRVLLDGDQAVCEFSETGPKELLEQTSVPVFVVPEPGATSHRAWTACARQLAAALKPGSHKVRVRYPAGRAVEATFELECTEATLATLRERAEAAYAADKAAEKAAREMPAAAMTDAALEKDFLDAFASQKWDGTALKAVITDKEWNVVKNELTGAIIRRWLGAAVGYKLPDGNCKLRSISIEQVWDGLAYGTSRFSGQGIEQHDIDCAKVK